MAYSIHDLLIAYFITLRLFCTSFPVSPDLTPNLSLYGYNLLLVLSTWTKNRPKSTLKFACLTVFVQDLSKTKAFELLNVNEHKVRY